ncbi:MAG: nickel pincer cofactor biosynthesis protein LarB, partial [Bacillota bacterium]|nr:nickel pincer cofactor biosynthesis protein LarB [Bacillota bacterium]
EVVYCKGKTTEQSVAIIKTLYERSEGNILATKCSEDVFETVQKEIPAAAYYPLSGTLTIYQKERESKGSIAVITAGTSDLPVAEEAAVTAEIMGNHVLRITDVGVAGIHRLLAHQEEIQQARVLIVIAGMDGALPSVIGGLFAKPLIAVPTSVGYGANFGGLAALLSMLNSCASGITVVNIDNGFGAACAASRINQLGD